MKPDKYLIYTDPDLADYEADDLLDAYEKISQIIEELQVFWEALNARQTRLLTEYHKRNGEPTS